MTTMAIPDQPAEPLLEAAPPAPVPEPAPLPPSIADGVERALDPRKVTLDRVVGWITAGVISLGSSIPIFSIVLLASIPGGVKALLLAVWTAVALLLAWSAQRWPVIEHRHASYKVDGQGIEIRKGVVWRKVINVPRSRVQHTDVSQGPLERRFGLGTLVIYTAGTDHAKVDLAGLDHATAMRIRDHFLPGEGGDAV
ncbi:MAG TPA: PH domain-containing protein [Thermoanaerobaculia bacterium]|nr:PH domain-containing protein [Thermoanaerobaculia bacterium]